MELFGLSQDNVAKSSRSTLNHVTHGAPVVRRQIEQWQFVALNGVPRRGIADRCRSQASAGQTCGTPCTRAAATTRWRQLQMPVALQRPFWQADRLADQTFAQARGDGIAEA